MRKEALGKLAMAPALWTNTHCFRSVVSELAAAGHTAHFIKLDVTSQRDWDTSVQEVKSKFGRIDVLVNNAGWTYRRKNSEEVTEAEFDRKYRDFETIQNLVSAFFTHAYYFLDLT